MIYNRKSLLEAAPIKDMLSEKISAHGVTYGMSEAGYDIRIKQSVQFLRTDTGFIAGVMYPDGPDFTPGRFALASAVEEFQMPTYLTGIVHDKSSWARRGLSVFNTVIEPGWSGFLTLELVYHGDTDLIIPAGAGIAQVIFHQTSDFALYKGRYQNQADEPVPAIKA